MKLEFYLDRKKEHRWRLKGRNGRIVATCGEGYRRRIDCHRIAFKLFPQLQRTVR